MIAFLLPMVLVSLALVSGLALVDSALRWWSAYRLLYPVATRSNLERRPSHRPRRPRQSVLPAGRGAVRPPELTRAAA